MDFDKIKAKIDKLLNSPEFDKMMEKEGKISVNYGFGKDKYKCG